MILKNFGSNTIFRKSYFHNYLLVYFFIEITNSETLLKITRPRNNENRTFTQYCNVCIKKIKLNSWIDGLNGWTIIKSILRCFISLFMPVNILSSCKLTELKYSSTCLKQGISESSKIFLFEVSTKVKGQFHKNLSVSFLASFEEVFVHTRSNLFDTFSESKIKVSSFMQVSMKLFWGNYVGQYTSWHFLKILLFFGKNEFRGYSRCNDHNLNWK